VRILVEKKFECSYRASDNVTVYKPSSDLSGQWFTVEDPSNNQTVYFAVCNIWNLAGPCPYSYEAEDSSSDQSHHGRRNRISVCAWDVKSDKFEVLGLLRESQWSDSPAGIENGFEIMYKSPESSRKTVLELVCDETVMEPLFTISHPDETVTLITVNSSSACPASNYPTVGGIEDYTWRHDHSFFEYFPYAIIAFGIGSCVLSLCCCCCAARKKKQVKKVASAKFSNVAFEPIPSSFQPAQPQYFYYYPPQATTPPASQRDNNGRQYPADPYEFVELNTMV